MSVLCILMILFNQLQLKLNNYEYIKLWILLACRMHGWYSYTPSMILIRVFFVYEWSLLSHIYNCKLIQTTFSMPTELATTATSFSSTYYGASNCPARRTRSTLGVHPHSFARSQQDQTRQLPPPARQPQSAWMRPSAASSTWVSVTAFFN